MFVFVLQFPELNFAQQRIAHVQPDALGPGMTIAMEVLAPAKDTGAFGIDGVYWPSSKILLANLADSERVVFGPVVVSWNGRVLQVPVTAKLGAATTSVPFQILTGNKKSASARFEIKQPQSKLSISGGATLGDGSFALYSFFGSGNTIVADEIEFFGTDIQNKGLFIFSKEDDGAFPGNPHYHPVTLLSRGSIHLHFAEVSVSADSLNGGPGGGGGGHGWSGTGGAGYTGGGSDSGYSSRNIGSGSSSTPISGGGSSTGILGGASTDSLMDQGGGGGTGCPYGSSGTFSGGNDSSHFGGYGGASAGGEAPGAVYGGGGGAFATNGARGAGIGNNSGIAYGGNFLLPMQGGSGGGAGNHISDLGSAAGSGGGGGGGVTLISYDTLSIDNSLVTANGANGISGINTVDAGGGGGAGGGILLSGRNGITLSNANISSKGGSGGLGGQGIEQISKGGDGGAGRIRVDGEIHSPLQNYFTTGVFNSGPTLTIPTIPLAGPFVSMTGFAGDSVSLTDSIRIYYRSHHTQWRFVQTERFGTKGKLRWQTFLPAGHDSSLFVTAMAQVRSPNRSFANFEPEYLLSHLSSGIIRIVATPHLVLLQDTLIFGCYKVGDTCVSANFYISNWGEDRLHIDSIKISNPNFHIVQGVNDLGYYLSDSIIITYCPKTVGKDTATITLYSNDSIRTAVLIGCGINKDTRITLKPTALDFGRIQIGKCDTLKITARSVGKDSALLSPNGLVHPPFEILKPLKDTLLAPKDSIQIFISFCPTDTGIFHSSFILTEKRDSVALSGIGTRKALKADMSLQGKSLCINDCDTIKLHFSSIGNDPVVVTSVTGVSFVPKVLPITIPPQTDTEFTVRYCAAERGDVTVDIAYVTNADSSIKTALHYHGILPEFTSDTSLHFGSLCIPAADSLPFSIHRTGSDTIIIDSIRLKNASSFALSGNISSKTDSTNVMVHFIPSSSGNYSATLIAFIHSGSCSDSLVQIPIDGSASHANVILSKTAISFGSMDTGSCKDDSVSITSSCQATIALPVVQPPFSIVSPLGNSFSLNGGETRTIIFRYCPSAIGNDSDAPVFSSSSDGNDTIRLSGAGRSVIDSPFVRFKLADTVATAGQEISYLIQVDSMSAGTNIKFVQGSLHYDPTLIRPLSMKGITWSISNNSEIFPGIYHFQANGSDSLRVGRFATLEIFSLYGTHDKSPVILDSIIVSAYARAVSATGSIQVVHCGNLPGHITVAGEYALGNPAPNPGTTAISLPVLLGTDGILRIKIYNASGMAVVDRSMSLKRGENTIIVDVATLPSGIYYLSADSWGWCDGKTLVIVK